MKTLVVMSGGMDSTTLLYECVKLGDEVQAISFNYGQKHKIELEKAVATCQKLGITHKLVDVSFLKDLLPSALTSEDSAVPEGHYADETMKQTVVPFRNTILSSIALGVASGLKYDRIALGVHAGDHAIYPDCRPEFIDALRQVAALGDYQKVDIYTPFINLSKGDIALVGMANGTDYSLTWTCYKGQEPACGKCGSCVERVEAFDFAESIDPIQYEN